MESGCVVEYIDQQRILCAVVIEAKDNRLRLLSETAKEVRLSEHRLSHASNLRLDLSAGRDETVHRLREIALRRKALIASIDVRELWDVLGAEAEWIDLPTMTGVCFPGEEAPDYEAAVVRAFFRNRLYFKFNADRFYPHSPEQVAAKIAEQEERRLREKLIEEGCVWVEAVLAGRETAAPNAYTDGQREFVDLLRSVHLFEKESPHYKAGRQIMARIGVRTPADLFPVLVALGTFDPDENVELLRLKVPIDFDAAVFERADELIAHPELFATNPQRKDLTMLPLMTIDGQATLDFDDALSIEYRGDHYRLGIHIADVGHFIKDGDAIDRSARQRGSSIYMPDCKIPMLPPCLAEGLCSLKAGEYRPAISLLVRLNSALDIIDYDILPSWVRVMHQFTYYDVNQMADDNRDIVLLRDIAERFRNRRLEWGAIPISLPEINVWMDADGKPNVSRVNRESPGRMLVAEIMIMANWLMTQYLRRRSLPAVYRFQAPPKDRLYRGDSGTLFQNWMQRRLLARFGLGHRPEPHAGLGLDAYLTATSPIRKYLDLVTQRQVRASLGLESLYSAQDIDAIIDEVLEPIGRVGQLQRSRSRYWLLRHMESRVGGNEEAIVLGRRRRGYQILLKEYMVECIMGTPPGVSLKPEDLVEATIQQVDARRDQIVLVMRR